MIRWRTLLEERWFPALLFVVICLGGASVGTGRANMVLAVAGWCFCALFIGLHLVDRRRMARGGWLAMAPFALILLLAALQLLTPSIWASDWHRLANDVRQSIGLPAPHPTASLDASSTARVLSSIGMPLAVLLGALGCSVRERRFALLAVALAACASAIAALAGLSALGPAGDPRGGLLANPNHQGLLMALGLLAGAGWVSRRRSPTEPKKWAVLGAIAIVTGVGCVRAGSLAGALFYIISLAAALWLMPKPRFEGASRRGLIGRNRRVALYAVPAALLAFGVVAAVIWGAGSAPGSPIAGGRLAAYGEIIRWAPGVGGLGSGLGTFADAAAVQLPLDLVDDVYLNHAHNEPLQILVESGWLGLLCLTLWLATAAWAIARRLLRQRADARVPLSLVTLMLAVVAAHSLLDYPVRTLSIAAIAAVALAFALVRPDRPGGRPNAWIGIPLILLCCWTASLAHRALGAEAAYQRGDLNEALRLDPHHSRALVQRAAEKIRSGPEIMLTRQEALPTARRAVAAAPLHPPAFYLALETIGPGTTEAQWETLARLGLRERASLLERALRAVDSRRSDEGARALSALFRLRDERAEAVAAALALQANDPTFMRRLVNETPRDRLLVSSLPVPNPLRDFEVLGFARLLSILAEGGDVPPRIVAPFLHQLHRQQLFDDAAVTYTSVYPERAPFDLSPYPGGIDAIGATPFDWTASDADLVKLRPSMQSETRLFVAISPNDEPVSIGRFVPRLTPFDVVELGFTSSRGGGEVSVSVGCGEQRIEATDTVPANGSRTLRLKIPEGARSCLSQSLQIRFSANDVPRRWEIEARLR
ncbi:O-antigen ligase family protein [Sphingomicrobium sp. XHP0235]|uniref:O-antigen ligase family protein n=1 Tax=Sphingomicrobium aquimarinum TaxID=3133971 RepID=UPI0031FE5894